MADDFWVDRTHYVNVEHIKDDIYIADLFYGISAKVPNPRIFRMSQPETPGDYVGNIRRLHGWRKGTFEAYITTPNTDTILIQSKDMAGIREMAIKAVETFV